jgi:hypothetical protein
VTQIVYFCPSPAKASGGVKVIYRHARLINELCVVRGLSSCVHHFERPTLKCPWYEDPVPLKADGLLIADRDFVVLPECHLYDFWRRLSIEGIRYGIFVQNAYLIGGGLRYEEIREAFLNAALVITISEDSQRYVNQMFPEISDRVMPVRWSINPELFRPSSTPARKISFMPRRMLEHVRLVCDLIRNGLPTDWSLVALDGLTESQIAEKLRDSRIFMSFSGLEGLPLPPAEAALAGNRVVGYHGQGGLEYWDPALFREVSCGDIQGFAKAVLEEVKKDDERSVAIAPATEESQATARELLRQRFSPQREAELLSQFVRRVAEVMGSAPAKVP